TMVRGYLAGTPLAALAFVLLIGIAAFALSMGASAFALAIADPLRRRLGQLTGAPDRALSTTHDIADYIRPLFPYLVPRKEGERSRVGRLLMHAGFRSPAALPLYYGCKTLFMVALPLLVMFASVLLPRVTGGKLIFAAVTMGFLGSLIPSVWLDHRVSKR